MTEPASVPNRTPDERLAFDVAFVQTWHRAWGTPSLVLIDWKRAHQDSEILSLDGKTAALRQLWELRRDSDYVRRPRNVRRYIQRPRPRPTPDG